MKVIFYYGWGSEIESLQIVSIKTPQKPEHIEHLQSSIEQEQEDYLLSIDEWYEAKVSAVFEDDGSGNKVFDGYVITRLRSRTVHHKQSQND